MKGIVFTEFLEMVESRFGIDMVDRIIESADVPTGGAYTAVGTYNHAELVRLVVALSQTTDQAVPDLLREFGRYLFPQFARGYARFFQRVGGVTEFLTQIDRHIHVEVLKLYPDAELPQFDCHTNDAGELELVYSSTRPLADFAEGLILGCIAHFGEPYDLTRESLPSEDGYSERFTLKRRASP